MNIAVIGAGFTGLSAARRLAGAGHNVTIIERESLPGGLAAGFTGPGWDWPLEKHYHHTFSSDSVFLSLAKELIFRLPSAGLLPQLFIQDGLSSLIPRHHF